MRILKGIFPPTYGQAFVGGYDVLKDKKKVRSLTSLLPETPSVYERLTPWEFLDFIGGLYNVEESILEKRIEKLLSLFDLMDRSDDLLQSFSKGMRQKVLISSTLINDPEIIFFDEPLAGLDPPAAKMVKDLILALTSDAEKNRFYLLISSPTKLRLGMLLQTIFMMAAMGTARIIPGIPHNQPQKKRKNRTTRGLNPNPLPISCGSTKLPMVMWIEPRSKKIQKAGQSVSN